MEVNRRIAEAKTMEDAVKIFKEELAKHSDEIENYKQKIRDAFVGKTPKTPIIAYDLTDAPACIEGRWADTRDKRLLCNNMQQHIMHFDLCGKFDYVPGIMVTATGDSSYIPEMFGTVFEKLPNTCLLVKKPAIESAADVDTLVMPDLEKDPVYQDMKHQVEFFREALDGAIDIFYPGLQGPSTNSLRILPEDGGLMDMLEYPEEMEKLALLITNIMVYILKGLIKTAGGAQYFRPRSRFYQDESIKGLFVDDWISIVAPETYYEIYKSSWELMYRELGNTYLHTCGPVKLQAELLTKLPGLSFFETAFISNQHKTVQDLREMKQALGGKVMFGSFGLPFGEIAEDEENISRKVIEELSEGGHFAIHAYGNAEYAKELERKLEL